MPVEFSEAPDDVVAIVMRQLRAHHHDLVETKCVIGVLMARTEDGSPAVKYHGAPALATITVVSARHRVKKKCDAEILIDGGEWDKLDDKQKAALADHELSHLKRVEYSEKTLARLRKENPDAPAWRLDCHGRPRLKTIPADLTPGDAFAEVIERHGESAVEFLGAKRFHEFAKAAMHGRLA